MEISKHLINNIPVTLIKTPKFKTTLIEITFLGAFTKENATKRSLLTRLLTAATKNYPTKKAIANRLFELYDASVGINSMPSYETNVTTFTMELINDKFVPTKTSLITLGIEFISEMLFNPNISEGKWDEHDFEEQKKILKAHITNIYNHKSRYATQKLIQSMCVNEITAVSSLGDLDDLQAIDAKEMYRYYKDFLENDFAHIYVVGDFSSELVLDAFSKLPRLKSGNNPYLPMKELDVIPQTVKKLEERQSLNQAKLVMGFRTLINQQHPLLMPALIFNGMFGGTFSSDLVQTIREQHSLCYSISSSINVLDKLMLINAGIDGENSDKVQSFVLKILNQYQNGVFEKNNFQIAKDLMINELNEMEDSPEDVLDFISKNDLLNRKWTIEELIEQINATTPSQIQEVAKGIYLDTVFLLANEVNHD